MVTWCGGQEGAWAWGMGGVKSGRLHLKALGLLHIVATRPSFATWSKVLRNL